MLSAKLHLDGTSKNKDIQLKSFEYQFNVKVNELGKPESNVHGGIIELSFKSIEDKDFIEWMILEAGDKSGTIEIAGDTQSKAFRTMEFSGARLVHFSESFAEPDDMITKIKISARKIILEGVAHESYLGKAKRFAKSALKNSGAIAEGAGGVVRGAYYTNRLLGDDKELKVDVNLPDEQTPPADNIAEGRRGGSAGSNTAFIPPISRPATPGNFKESKNLAEEVKEGAEKGKQEKDKETETESEEIS